jgi:hypothetical protein
LIVNLRETAERRHAARIDVVVVAPRFDRPFGIDDVDVPWLVPGRTDRRIEPIPGREAA